MSTTNEAVVGNLQQLLGKLEANKADLPQLEISMTKLGTVMTRVMDLSKQQGAMTAGKQAASKELQTLLIEGQRLANGMRALVKGALWHPVGKARRVRTAAVPRPGPHRQTANPGTGDADRNAHSGAPPHHHRLVAAQLDLASGACFGTPRFVCQA